MDSPSVYAKDMLRWSKSRRNNERDDHRSKFEYIMINLVLYHRVFIVICICFHILHSRSPKQMKVEARNICLIVQSPLPGFEPRSAACEADDIPMCHLARYHCKHFQHGEREI